MTTRAHRPTVNQNDHVAAAAYLMKHLGVTVLSVLDGQWPGRPIGIIAEHDIVEAAAASQDLNEIRIRDLLPGSRLATCAGQLADSGQARPV